MGRDLSPIKPIPTKFSVDFSRRSQLHAGWLTPEQIPGWHRSAVARADQIASRDDPEVTITRSSPSPTFDAALPHVVGNAGVESHRPRWDYNKQRRRYHNVT